MEKEKKWYQKWWCWVIILAMTIVIGFIAIVFYGFSLIKPDEVLADFAEELQEYDDNIIVYQSVGKNVIIIQCYTETNEEISEKSGEIGKIKGKYKERLSAYKEIKIYFYSNEGLSIVLTHNINTEKTDHDEWIQMGSDWYKKLEEELRQNEGEKTEQDSFSTQETISMSNSGAENNTTVEDGQTNSIPAFETPTITMGQKNALSKAKDYLYVSAFSYKGLIEQLEFEGFSTEEATYGVDNCGADWNEQAAKKAKDYINTMSFSRSGLVEQLEFEGFTREQAEYAATSVGY